MKDKKKKRKKRTKLQKAIRVVSTILIILVVMMIAIVAGGWTYISSRLNIIRKELIDENAIGINDKASENLKNYRNIALFGIDSRADDYSLGNRSDCIIIASINEKTNDVKLVSVYRDSYLQLVEGSSTRLDKVTHAYAYGGAQNALLALNTNLDLNIKEYVTVNFDAVIAAVNALGGVTINIDSQELRYINSYIDALIETSGIQSKHVTKTGEQTLDGVQAVAYSRIRYTDGGDFKRTERMRTVLEAMVSKAKTRSLTQINNFINVILPKISTNLSSTDILSLVPVLFKVNFTDSIGWPYDVKGYNADRWYGVPTTLESNVIRLHKEIFENENYELPQEIKEISDKIVAKTGFKAAE